MEEIEKPNSLEEAKTEEQLGEKTISEVEPFELEMALKQVIRESGAPLEETPETPVTNRNEGGATEPDKAKVEKKGDYENSFNLFADIFYGVLVAPRQTMLILSNGSKYPPNAGHISQAIFFVVLVLSMIAWLRFRFDAPSTAGSVLAFAVSGACNWICVAFLLYYLSIFLRSRLRLGNAIIATAWSFLPLIFLAPLYCFKHALGPLFFLLATLPVYWFLFLLWTTFHAALKTTHFKLGLILIVVPPLLAFVYLFWVGLSLVTLILQILPKLS